MGERFVAVAKVLSGRLCQPEFSKLGTYVRNNSGHTEFLEAVLSE
jgi:hypothetical protein